MFVYICLYAVKLKLHMNGSEQAHVDAFIHQVAIKLSRALNLIVPNDLLAERVISIARSNNRENFLKGEFRTV